MAATQRLGACFVAIGEPLYPPWLRHGDAPPPLIAVRGDTRHLTSPAIAIVGARNASVAGRKMAALLARGLGEADFVVVSGLARGIDAAAHEAALGSGTIAVFAGGIDTVYPRENEDALPAHPRRRRLRRQRDALRLGAARARLSPPQPHHRGDGARDGRGGGGGALRLAHHRAAGA